MAERTCSIDDCGEPVKARGWCGKHWKRWRKYGDPLTTHPKGAAATPEAEAERRRKIAETLRGRTYGPRSEETRRKISEALTGRKMPEHQRKALIAAAQAGRAESATKALAQWERWRGERGLAAPGYGGLHARVRKQRGLASGYQCVECGNQALHWATIHGTNGTDPTSHYQPMCESCHFAYDEVAVKGDLRRLPGDRAAAARLAWSRRSPERRAEIGRKIWETRRRNQGRPGDAPPSPPLVWP